MTKREIIIQRYVDGYNRFDTDAMVADFGNDIVFENIQNGQLTMSLSGLESFVHQAEMAKTYFSERKQTIKSYRHTGHLTEVEIDYEAVLAMDFPNGLKKGQALRLAGKSVFEFADDKIIKLTDIA